MMGNEFFVLDENGNKQDAGLHAPILRKGDDAYRKSDIRAAMIERAVKVYGLTKEEAEKLY